MLEIIESDVFSAWIASLRDQIGRAAIQKRIRRMSLGNFGDVSPVGSGVSEIRVHSGPGYRVYFIQRGKKLIMLLSGGDKSSQLRDILQARKMAAEIKDELGW
jgi:putative addiction module killer protein